MLISLWVTFHCYRILFRSCFGWRFCLNVANLRFVCVDYDYVFLRLRSLPGLFLAITISLSWTVWVWLTHLLPQVLQLRNAPEPKKDGRCLQRRLFSCGLRSSVPRKSFAMTTGGHTGQPDPPTQCYWLQVWKSGWLGGTLTWTLSSPQRQMLTNLFGWPVTV